MGSLLNPTLANAFLVYHEKIVYKVVHSNIDPFCIKDMLMVYLFYLISQNI